MGVSSVGLSGGLALLWRKNVQLGLVSFSKYHIDAKLTLEDDGRIVRITGIYGEPYPPQRHVTWSLLRTLRNNEQQPWFVGGDFNEILHNGEKEGGRVRSPHQMMAFNMALTECGLADMGYMGRSHTWSNNRSAPRTVRCRLDRVCANQLANSQFPSAVVSHIEQPGSDHIPIMLHLERPVNDSPMTTRKPF